MADIHTHFPMEEHCRKLFLRNYELLVRIGAHEFEKNAAQRVVFNVDLYVALADSSPQSDQLGEVLDYDFVRHLIAQRVERGHVELQETLCDDLAHQLLQHPKVRAVRLSTCKPDIYPDCAGVGVEVFLVKR